MRKLKVKKVNFFGQAHNATVRPMPHDMLQPSFFSITVPQSWKWSSRSINPRLLSKNEETEAQKKWKWLLKAHRVDWHIMA